MALQVWLPLNKEGDFNNRGLADITIANNSISYDANGKIGGCYKLGSGKSLLTSDISIPNSQYTICCWFKYTEVGTPTIQYIIDFAVNSSSNTLLGIQKDTNNTFSVRYNGSTSPVLSATVDTWYHLAATYDGTTIRVYVNGVEVKSLDVAITYYKTGKFGIGQRPDSTIFYPTGLINDVRLYDHCLSPKEVKEISKGLVLHYPLNECNITYNLISNTGNNSQVSCGAQNSGKITRLSDNVIHCTVPSSGTNNNTGIQFYVSNLIIGQTYTFSADIRGNCNVCRLGWFYTNTNDQLQKSTPWTTNITLTENYKRYYYIFTVPNDYKSIISLNISLGTNDTSWCDVKNIKLETGKNENPIWLPSETDTYTFPVNIIHDCSGYENNGTITGTLTTSTDTPRYNKCTVFNSSNGYITSDVKSTECKTVSLWAFIPSTFTSQQILFADGKSKLALGLYSNGQFIISCNGDSKQLANKNDIKLNNWNHFIVIKDSINKLYINGIQQTTSGSSSWTHTSGNLMIGRRNDNTDGFTNKISDFRIYSTALSDEDILELYNTSAFIADNGSLECYQFEEEGSNPQVEKSGEIKVNELNEMTEYGELYYNTNFNSYIPGNNVTNAMYSLGSLDLTEYKTGDILDFYFRFEYSGFNQNPYSNFDVGSNDGWSNSSKDNWDKPINQSLPFNKLKSDILTNNSGICEIHFTFKLTTTYGGTNATYQKAELALRFDYSNGIGKIKCLESRVSTIKSKKIDLEQTKFGQDYITANQIIEI